MARRGRGRSLRRLWLGLAVIGTVLLFDPEHRDAALVALVCLGVLGLVLWVVTRSRPDG